MSERLHPADVEAIAAAVVRRLRDEPPIADGRWLSAAEVASMLGVSREWTYRHVAELGAVRIGSGSRPRLRFDAERVSEALSARRGSEASPSPHRPPRRRRRAERAGFTRAGSPLLPVPGPRGAS